EALFKRALTIREKVLGASHAHVGQTLYNLGLVNRDQGKYGEAEEFLKRALVIRERALGASHARHHSQQPGARLSRPGEVRRGGGALQARIDDLGAGGIPRVCSPTSYSV